MIASTLSRFHPARLLAPVCRRSFYEGLIGSELPQLYSALRGSFPFRHACNLPLQATGLRTGSSQLRVALRLGMPRHVQQDGTQRVALYSSRNSSIHTICHFREGRLALVQQVFASYAAASEVLSSLEQQYGFRLPAQEEDFLLFNAAGERLVIRLDHTLQLFYYSASALATAAAEQVPARSSNAPAQQLALSI